MDLMSLADHVERAAACNWARELSHEWRAASSSVLAWSSASRKKFICKKVYAVNGRSLWFPRFLLR